MNENIPTGYKETDYKDRDIWHTLDLSKQGDRDKDFDELVNKLSKKLKDIFVDQYGLLMQLAESQTLELNDYQKALVSLYNNPTDLIVPQFSPERVQWKFKFPRKAPIRAGYDTIKHEIQAQLKKERKYEGYNLANTWSYLLSEEEVQELNLEKILSGISQQLQGFQSYFYPAALTPEGITALRKHEISHLGTAIYLKLTLNLLSPALDTNFYSQLENLINYLYSEGLVRQPNMPDIIERFTKAIEDINKENQTPYKFRFFITSWPIEMEKFEKLRKELLDRIATWKTTIELTSDPNQSDVYGCYCYY